MNITEKITGLFVGPLKKKREQNSAFGEVSGVFLHGLAEAVDHRQRLVEGTPFYADFRADRNDYTYCFPGLFTDNPEKLFERLAWQFFNDLKWVDTASEVEFKKEDMQFDHPNKKIHVWKDLFGRLSAPIGYIISENSALVHPKWRLGVRIEAGIEEQERDNFKVLFELVPVLSEEEQKLNREARILDIFRPEKLSRIFKVTPDTLETFAGHKVYQMYFSVQDWEKYNYQDLIKSRGWSEVAQYNNFEGIDLAKFPNIKTVFQTDSYAYPEFLMVVTERFNAQVCWVRVLKLSNNTVVGE